MKVYITSTPEFPFSQLEDVVKVLKSTPGTIDFLSSPPLNEKQWARVNKKIINIRPNESLTFDEFFELCDGHRDIREIDENSMVIILSNIKNDLNWFSAFRKNNIFIHGENWDQFTGKDAKYGIAHQIVENIFQSLINLKIEPELDELIHKKSIGCINDMCDDESEIITKLWAAVICPKCRKRADEEISDKTITLHIKEIINNLRDEFVRDGDDVEKYIPPIKVFEKGKVSFGNKEFKFEAKLGSFYVFFLKNLDGVPTKNVEKIVDDVIEEYRNIKGIEANIEPIARSLGYTITIDNTLKEKSYDCEELDFENVRTLIKRKLKKELGKELHNFYIINNIKVDKEKIYKINLEAEKITFNSNDK